MDNLIDILLQLAFELGQAYGRIYTESGLNNVIDFNDIAYANKCGAQWHLKGDIAKLPQLFKIHDKRKIDALNEIADNLQKVKTIAIMQINKEE